VRPVDIAAVRARLGWLYRAMLRKFYVDELYERTIAMPGLLMAEGMAEFDARGIDGFVNGLGRGTHALSQVGRRVQTGFVRSYALAVLFGTLLITALFLGGTLLGG
jgi:NADH-quinone oxidoreductase subunit L